MTPPSRDQNTRIEKFLTVDPKDLTKRAVEQELQRIRPQFGFSEAELRRLRAPRRKPAG